MDDFVLMTRKVKRGLTFGQVKNGLRGKWPVTIPMAMTLAARIKASRKSARLTQEELGKRINVSKAAVSQWESGGTIPDVHNLLRIADITSVNLSWLLTGQPLPEQDSNGGLSWGIAEGRTVPLLTARQAVAGSNHHIGVQRIPVTFPCSNKAFALIIDSRANAPLLLPGDRTVWDAATQPEPDDVVLAVFGADGIPVIGRVRYETGQAGTVTIVQPLNPSFPAFRSDHGELRIIAALHEHTRSARG